MVDRTYVNGIIAVKEVSLLGSRILKMCEGNADDALRTLAESGFARGAELASVYDYETVLEADQRDLDAFIREYAPSKAAERYLLTPRDYHNAKALLKAEYLKCDPTKLLAPEGMYTVERIKAFIDGEVCPDEKLASAIAEVKALLNKDGQTPSGAEIGIIFERALQSRLIEVCKFNKQLKKFLIKRADLSDILTVMRASNEEQAENNLFSLGKLDKKKLFTVFEGDGEKTEKAMDNTPYKDFWRECLKVRQKGLPQTEAEKTLAGLEEKFYEQNKYELSGGQPFLYYVFRRRAENQNVRIVMSCLLAGLPADDIKARLRSYE